MTRFNRFLDRAAAALLAAVTAVFIPQPEPMLARVRSRSRRGAGMLEYALVALISIAVFGVLVESFTGIFSTLADRIGGLLED